MKKWKTIVVLLFMLLAVIFNWSWFWGILLLFGLFHYLMTGEIHFVEVITKKETPVLYYIMLTFWSVLTYYSVLPYFSF